MSYEHNPRMSPGKKQRDQEQFDDVSPLSSTRTPYSGKRSVSVMRTKGRKPTERDTLTTEGGVVEHDAVSGTASNAYGLLGWSQVLFTIALVALVAAQAKAQLTIKVLLILIVVHNGVSIAALGVHHKMESMCAKSVDSEHKGLTLLRHMRNDRRSVLLFLSAVVSCIAAIDISYIARITPSLEVQADTFRYTGVNTYVNRAMDVLSIIVFALAVPTALLILTELGFKLQELMRRPQRAKVQDSNAEDEDEDEGLSEISSPRD